MMLGNFQCCQRTESQASPQDDAMSSPGGRVTLSGEGNAMRRTAAVCAALAALALAACSGAPSSPVSLPSPPPGFAT